MFKRILVPLDGSENAKKVLPIVVTEAKCHNAVVVLLHVISPLQRSFMASPNMLAQVLDELEMLTKENIEIVAMKIRTEGLEVETIIERGHPAEKIYEIAQNELCDLIIIGCDDYFTKKFRFYRIFNSPLNERFSMYMNK